MSRSDFTPVDVDAEAHVVAALLTSPGCFVDVVDELTPDDFGVPQLAHIYTAILRCDQAGMPFDQVTVAAELKRMKALDKAGGKEALERLVARGVEVDNVPAYVRIVADKSLLRRTLQAGRDIATAAQDPAADAETVLADAERSVFALGRTSTSSLVTMAQAVAEMQQEMARAASSEMLGLSTGLSRLDELTSGFQGGQLILVGGRPGAGKSALKLQIARHIAETTGQVVPFLSYEMSHSELTFRLLASAIQHPLQELRAGRLPDDKDKQRKVDVEAQKMAHLPLMLDDAPPRTVAGVRSQLRRLARRGPLAAVVIDYLQLMAGSGRGEFNRVAEIGEISRELKTLASELDVPIIAGSQLSRASVSGPGPAPKPSLHHLRDSGSLEQDASVVLLCHRPYAAGDVSVPPSQATLILAKQRNGPAGVDIPVEFAPEWATFYPSSRQPPSAPPPGSDRRRSGDGGMF